MKKSLIVTAIAATVTVVSAGIYAYNELHSNPKPIATETASPSVTPSPTPSGPAPSPSSSSTSPSPSSTIKTIAGLGTLKTSESAQADAALKSALEPDTVVYEEDVIGFMHHFIHQKVEASDKWVSIEMTPERCDLLVELLEKKGKDFEHYDKMIEIAKRWQSGDFSKAKQDHNYFWKLENGTIGEATGLLTKEEEKKFVEQNFHK